MNTEGGSTLDLEVHVIAIGHKVVEVLPGVGVRIETGDVIESVTWERDAGYWLYTARFA